jgi:hypothetical protein
MNVLFSKFRWAPGDIYHKIWALSEKCIAQSVRLTIYLHTPPPVKLYGLLLMHRGKYVFDLFGAENTIGHENCIQDFGLKPEGKRKLGRPRNRSEDNIDNLKVQGATGFNWIKLYPVGGFCEHCNRPSGS